MKPPKIIEFSYYPNPSGIKGFYDGDVPGYVYIRDDLVGLLRELVVIHESQHAKCHGLKCDCFDLYSDFRREYHAIKAEFDFMCAGRYTKYSWNVYFRQVHRDLKRYKENKIWLGHFKALAKVCRLKLFGEYAELHRSLYKRIMKLVSEVKK